MTNQSIAGKRSFRAILSTIFALILIIGTFASTALADGINQYDVTIIDNSEEYAITTTETEPIEILEKAGITLSADDNLDISGFEEGKGGKIVISRLSDINIKFDNRISRYSVYAQTVGEAFDELGIAIHKDDEISHSLDASVKDGMIITIKSAFSVSLTADGKTQKFAMLDGTVEDLINLAGIELGDDDYTEPSLDTKLKKDLKVKVMRVEYKVESATESISFKVKQTKDKTLDEGKTKVLKKGVKGSADVTYKVKYVNGKAEEKEVLTRVVTKSPVAQEEKVGTKPVKNSVKPNGVKSKNGFTVGQTISGRYTHYDVCARCCGNARGITASGKRIYNGMKNPYYIACNWLPMGSVVSVDGQNYTVVDRGGGGLSNVGRIDIYTPEGHSAALKKGTGSCTLKIVRLGW